MRFSEAETVAHALAMARLTARAPECTLAIVGSGRFLACFIWPVYLTSKMTAYRFDERVLGAQNSHSAFAIVKVGYLI